ncbi:hypothetical protein RKE29_13365 [Streptomyces sp. B1866]|uniref:hypothetical protein n=1 Tax=Streptomyces sp. B1866 TaxID=3075431 RepID=UPI00288F1ECB|nr:hypothetical protein [Streptomyces sp. B1866]MDT3397629.1 hypothetical protein [Streptomyces sp. B1866]
MAGTAGIAARARAAARAPGPGQPGGTVTTAAADARIPIATTVARYRLRALEPRSNRVSPRFNDPEWQAVQAAAVACGLKDGAFIASAAEALLDPDAAHRRRWLEAVIHTNHTLATVGTSLNAFTRHLNSGGTPHHHAHHLLDHVGTAISRTRAAITWTPPANDETPADRTARIQAIVTSYRRRLGPRRDIRRCPRFSDHHWAQLTATARACRTGTGALVAAAALHAADTADPRAALADPRRQVEELMETNRLLAAVGNNLAQALRHFTPGNPLHTHTAGLLDEVEKALDLVDTTATTLAGR